MEQPEYYEEVEQEPVQYVEQPVQYVEAPQPVKVVKSGPPPVQYYQPEEQYFEDIDPIEPEYVE